MKHFINTEVDLKMEYRCPRYNDFRDWFIIDDDKNVKIHRTKIVFWVNDYLLHEDEMPIDTKVIHYKIKSGLKKEMTIENFKFQIPEMGITKNEFFPNPSFVGEFDVFTLDGELDFGLFD